MSKNPGAAWEAVIAEENEWLAARGIARAVRVKPPVNHLGPMIQWLKKEMRVEIPACFTQRAEGLFIGVANGKPSVDFEGSVRGHAVAFDAKSSEAEPSWPLADIRDDQLDYLADCARAGELAFLYVERRGGRGRPRYILPVDREGRVAGQCHKRDRLGALLRRDARESVRWEDLEQWRCQPGELWADAVARMRPMWPGIKEGA